MPPPPPVIAHQAFGDPVQHQRIRAGKRSVRSPRRRNYQRRRKRSNGNRTRRGKGSAYRRTGKSYGLRTGTVVMEILSVSAPDYSRGKRNPDHASSRYSPAARYNYFLTTGKIAGTYGGWANVGGSPGGVRNLRFWGTLSCPFTVLGKVRLLGLMLITGTLVQVPDPKQAKRISSRSQFWFIKAFQLP